MTEPSANDHLRRLLAQQLESLESAGVEHLPRLQAIPLAEPTEETTAATPATLAPEALTAPPAAPTTPETPAAPAAATENAATENATAANAADDTDTARRERLEILRQEVSECTRCSALVESRTQTVFGVGSIRPRLCFFGEAPGRDEDVQGEPFVGAAGQLLNKIIQAMTLKREDVYILNVLKCRPPGNRNPETDEVSNCRPFFERQLEILQPEFICCLGAYAARTLLNTELSVGKLRGSFLRYGEARVVVTYHPAYLLRNESAKRSTWEDMQMLMREMGLQRGPNG